MEQWKQIADFPSLEVSSLGRVRRGDVIKTPFTDDRGYLAVNLSHEGRKTCSRIHRLVAEAFLENPDAKTQVDHINQDKTDNRVENLRWQTHQENAINRGANRNNRSGHKNISWCPRRHYWRLQIIRNGRVAFRGEYADLDDALLNREEILSR